MKSLLPVRKHRCVDDEGDQAEADGEGGEAEATLQAHGERSQRWCIRATSGLAVTDLDPDG